MEAELQDWELLQHTSEDDDDYDVVVAAPAPAADDDDDEFSEFDESESGIRSDYFSLDSNYNNRGYANPEVVCTAQEENEFVDDDQGSVQSDNPSWLDPSSQGITFETKGAGAEFWSDSASDGSSVSRKFEGFECKHDELGFVDDGKSEVGFHGNDEKIMGSAESSGETEIPAKFESGDSGNENKLGVSTEADGGEGRRGELGSADGIGSLSAQVVNSGEGGGDHRGGNVWWKLPLELLKFCVFRVSPVWSVSIAAAVVGFVILKRRLFKMKHKTQRIALNVTLEDKKVSQFMARAARLNEAFSVVKHVPMIRPSVPAAGLTPWPVMSLR
ncbi:hypothetical protein C5167_025598 [Papaver somniferum]|uniref:DUF6821 domain-containing protein n=1 Tax=Papaver somniferum TaxID=3469 RepID=A0A4Y7JVW7_PAPSO|nr:uncharacterized protein LOC113284347 isoform X1 [Papaver somniferum]RZC63855.1 hypothetical protein C5167_025598 [Papaver somniferum]